MKRPDDKVIQALYELDRNSHPFSLVKQWFEESLDEQLRVNEDIEGLQEIGKGQGKSRTMRYFLNQVKEAGEARIRIEKNASTLSSVNKKTVGIT